MPSARGRFASPASPLATWLAVSVQINFFESCALKEVISKRVKSTRVNEAVHLLHFSITFHL